MVPTNIKHMRKVRIIKRTSPDGCVSYVIQQKHWLFWWWWVDASCNSSDLWTSSDSFGTLDAAKANLCRFDGTKSKDEVVFESYPNNMDHEGISLIER